MKVKTHFKVAKIVSKEHDFTMSAAAAFCLGAIVPDIMPFYHPHYYKTSGDYVFRKLSKLAHKRSLLSFFMRGVMAHYVTDFCCSAHAEGLGNVKEHLAYENALEGYIKENFSEIKKRYKESEKATDLHEVINLYTGGERFNYKRDIFAALHACSALVYCYTPADRRPLITALNVRTFDLSMNFKIEPINDEIADAIQSKHGKHI
ncbi:MAG: zinc dependent phospholipase C family protein [Clostridia bacterium]|nr:zinc dependent phospholipase C family protein [Clostridia bacterium]